MLCGISITANALGCPLYDVQICQYLVKGSSFPWLNISSWSNMANKWTEAHQWFWTPLTIEIAQTFLRDDLEACYTNEMVRFNHCTALSEWKTELHITDIVSIALQALLLGRLWNKFHLARNYWSEATFRTFIGPWYRRSHSIQWWRLKTLPTWELSSHRRRLCWWCPW